MADASGTTQATTSQERTNGSGFQWQSYVSVQEAGILVIFLVWCTFLSISTDTFLTTRNVFNMLRSFSWIAIAAFGETLVVLVRFCTPLKSVCWQPSAWTGYACIESRGSRCSPPVTNLSA